MPEIHFDRYYRYDALTSLLNAFAAEYPALNVRTLCQRVPEGQVLIVLPFVVKAACGVVGHVTLKFCRSPRKSLSRGHTATVSSW